LPVLFLSTDRPPTALILARSISCRRLMFRMRLASFPSRGLAATKEYDDDETASPVSFDCTAHAVSARMRRTSTNVPIPTGGSPTRTCRPGVAGNSFSIRSTWRRLRRPSRRLRQRKRRRQAISRRWTSRRRSRATAIVDASSRMNWRQSRRMPNRRKGPCRAGRRSFCRASACRAARSVVARCRNGCSLQGQGCLAPAQCRGHPERNRQSALIVRAVAAPHADA
jgi:hypothetical protein